MLLMKQGQCKQYIKLYKEICLPETIEYKYEFPQKSGLPNIII